MVSLQDVCTRMDEYEASMSDAAVQQWRKARKMILTTHKETQQATESRGWVIDYLEKAERGGNDATTVRCGSPFMTDTHVYLYLDSLLRHVHIHSLQIMSRVSLENALRHVGWTEVVLTPVDEKNGSIVTRRYWVYPKKALMTWRGASCLLAI